MSERPTQINRAGANHPLSTRSSARARRREKEREREGGSKERISMNTQTRLVVSFVPGLALVISVRFYYVYTFKVSCPRTAAHVVSPLSCGRERLCARPRGLEQTSQNGRRAVASKQRAASMRYYVSRTGFPKRFPSSGRVSNFSIMRGEGGNIFPLTWANLTKCRQK